MKMERGDQRKEGVDSTININEIDSIGKINDDQDWR